MGRPLIRPSAMLVLIACSWAMAATRAEQHCDTQAAPSTPESRFQDHGDGTLTDTRSGLMWTRCSAGQAWRDSRCEGPAADMNWRGARAAVEQTNRGGAYFFNDWRLPKLPELATIAERRCSNPRINLVLFPATPAEHYWTASSRPDASADSAAYALSFGADGVQYDSKADVAHVRLVRNAR